MSRPGSGVGPADALQAGPAALRIAYVVGTHPTVSTTFIDREIAAMAANGVGVARVLSIREPAPEEVVRGGRGLGAELSGHRVPIAYLLAGSRLALVRILVTALLRRPAAIVRLGLAFLGRPPTPDGRRGRALFHLAEGMLAYDALRDLGVAYLHAQFGDRAATVAGVAARLLGVPFGVTVHGGDLQLETAALPARLRGAAIVATVSEWNRDALRRLGPSLPADRFLVYRPFLDLAAIAGRGVIPGPSDDVPATPLRILSVGRLVEKKGHADLIEACRIAVGRGLELRCRIIGGGPLEASLLARAAAIPGRPVEVLGPLPFDDVLRELGQADVFALASTVGGDGDRDGLPVAIGEAMAAGLPVISTRVVGIPELVRGGAGILVDPGSPEALAAAIEKLGAEGPRRRAERGRIGRSIVERDLDVRAEAGKLEAAIRTAVEAHGRRRRREIAPSRQARGMVLVWGEPFRAPRSRLLATELGARLSIVPPPGWSKARGPLARVRRAAGYAVQAARTLGALASVRPTGILVQAPPTPAVLVAAIYAAWSRRPFVIDVHSGALEAPLWRRPRWLVERVLRRAAAVIVHAPRWAEVVDAWGGRPILLPDVPNHEAALAPGGRRGAAGRAAGTAERAATADGPLDVVVVASASEDEPLDEVLAAAADVPWARFRITGPPPERDGHRPPPNVEFTGLLDEPRYLDLLRAADAVMALTTLPDTMQGGALQGLALGRPIVTSNSAFLHEWFSDAAVYVDADAGSIAGGISRVRTDGPALEAAGARVGARRAAEMAAAMQLVREALDPPAVDGRERRAGRPVVGR